jgi:hypothetical protein
MPEDRLPDAVIALIATYKAAQAGLIDAIVRVGAVGAIATYQLRVLDIVEKKLSALNAYAREWCNENIPKFYESGRNAAIEALKNAGVAEVRPSINERIVEILTENTYASLYDAHRYVGRSVRDQVRQAGLEATAQAFMTGQSAKGFLIKNLTDRGITAIRDRRGREIKLDAYAALVARSTTREAANQATIDQLVQNNHDLVKMSSHNTACAVCIPFENRVYSISGNDKRFPPLSIAFEPPYANIHPNCLHVLLPYIESLDGNVKETIIQSNRSYTLNQTDQKRVEAYKRQQEERRRLREDRMQWERYRTTLPNDTPKTFNGFRTSKRSGSERWIELERKYREARKEM